MPDESDMEANDGWGEGGERGLAPTRGQSERQSRVVVHQEVGEEENNYYASTPTYIIFLI